MFFGTTAIEWKSNSIEWKSNSKKSCDETTNEARFVSTDLKKIR